MNNITYLSVLLVLLCFSCKKVTNKEEAILFSEKEKEYCIALLKAYQNCDSITFNRAKEKAIGISKMKDSTDTQRIELYMDSNVIYIDSVANVGIDFIKENRYCELMHLLDKNKIEFYAHPLNNVHLMGDFNDLLATLYYRYYLPKEEVRQKIIETAIFRKIHCYGVIGFSELRGKDIEEYKEYIEIYKDELVRIIKLYREIGNTEKAMQYSDELLEIIDKERSENLQ